MMNSNPRDQVKTRIRSILKFDPSVSDATIARTLGISRQLVGNHTTRMKDIIRTGRQHLSCGGCGKRVNARQDFCRDCRKLAFGYEFRCAECGKVNVELGLKASQRRKLERANPERLLFCNKKCSGRHSAKRYWGIRKLAELST